MLGQGVVEAAHGAGAGGNSHQGLSDLPDFVGTHPAHKHLGQRFGYLWFIPLVALEHLTVKGSFPISGDFEILNAPGGSDEITGVGPVAIPSAIGSTFAPGGSDALFQFFTHDVFDQDLDGTHGQATYMLTRIPPARRRAADADSGVETSEALVVGLFLGTGIALSF